MSLVEVLNVVLLLKIADGFSIFMLIVALSAYWINFSKRLYANRSSTDGPAAAFSVSPGCWCEGLQKIV